MRNELNTGRASPGAPSPGGGGGGPVGGRMPGGRLRRALALALVCGAAAVASGQSLVPFEVRPWLTPYNLQSQSGVPISATAGTPPGSDGRMPVGLNESGSYNDPTLGQFRSFLGFGGGAVRTNWLLASGSPLLQGASPFSASVAEAMQLPRAYSNSAVSLVVRRAQLGVSYLTRKVDYEFGGQIEVPDSDETGTRLSVVKETYWLAEPFSMSNHLDSGYYYSPHAQKVFAIQAGPVSVTWRKRAPYTAATAPAGYVNQYGTRDFETNGSSIYLLYTANYIISGSASKPPLRMYWTEREYRVTGFPVSVPAGRVGGISIAYNTEFPRTVPEEYRGPGYTNPTEGGTNQFLPELRTLWYDQGQGFIYAYNREGRAFVEFLGDARPDGQTREHLGYEIVDVIKQPIAYDIKVELGERLLPPPPESGDDLYAEPVLALDRQFVHRHTDPVSGRLHLYATVETASQNDCLVHWLEAGTAGIRWPKVFTRYQQSWPREMAKYSHYVRPLVATEAEARQTAVQLAADNVPLIAYQDPLDRPRAKLTEDSKFYTYLDAAQPAHRTLLSFTSGDYVGFERVFSWLDGTLRSTNYAGSVATNLTEVDNYVNFATKYQEYTNRLAQALASWLPRYTAYTNYLRLSSQYETQLAAWTTYYEYTNAVAQYHAYTNAYTNWASQYAAYTNYLATGLPRGVNGEWKLFVEDFVYGYGGSISNWFVSVISTNHITGVRVTNVFSGSGVTIPEFGPGEPYPSTITVSGITNAVQSVQVGVNGYYHNYLSDVDIQVVGPANASACAILGRPSGYSPPSVLNLLFDDAAAGYATGLNPLPSGSYRPSDSFPGDAPPPGYGPRTDSLAALLNPVIADPGSTPTEVPNPDVIYADQIAAHQAYLDYVAGLTRGVNTDWTVTVADWWDNSVNGSISLFTLQVVTTNRQTGQWQTNDFSADGGGISYQGTLGRLIQVSGITNPVMFVRFKISGFSHGSAWDIHAWLSGPGQRNIALLDTPGAGDQSFGELDLVFDDTGAAPPYQGGTLTSTTYRPHAGTLAGLLDLPPGSEPPFAQHPVSYVAHPGATPAVVLEPEPVNIGPEPSPNLWASDFTTPRVDLRTVYVGDRIQVPTGEQGGGGYLAGYINQRMGRLFHPAAYLDPLTVGFETANNGAIIPVNAVPGTNFLEVLWFRTNRPSAGPNAGNRQLGFASILWPSVLGRYTIAYPPAPREIVLASKLGSGTLDPMEALGSIYRQNNTNLPGYNPNEEHALMSGGQAFATRDDLNLTNAANYSSHPFVLVQYLASDGRPAVTAFKVLREKPEAGYVFDYIVPAGQILQPPPPLTFLPKPILGSGDSAVNYNTEPPQSGGDLPGGWTSAATNNPLYAHYQRFTWRDRNHDFWVYRGPHAGIPALAAGSYLAASGTFTSLPNATAVAQTSFDYVVHTSREEQYLSLTVPGGLPDWLSIRGLTLSGTPASGDVGVQTLQLVIEDRYDHTRVTNSLQLTVAAGGLPVTQGPLVLSSTNSQSGTVVVFSNRPPVLAASPRPTNSFSMRYYYKTEASFDWPSVANPPAPGSIVPYLRPVNPANGEFIGNGAIRDTDSLEIVYRPVWPVRDPKDARKPVPAMPFGATLTTPKWDLPGLRDMLTARVLYQQSSAENITQEKPSVVLQDGTREKYSSLAAQSLTAVPGGVRKDYYQGKYYFPNLPPHLAARVFFDPNRGAAGSLVLRGEYVAETLGESYLMLNVLRGSDLDGVKGLCPGGDPNKAAWDTLVASLATAVETFKEDPDQPGSYIPDPARTVTVGVQALAEVTSDNTAVDSYALSATGPGTGYVTLIESDGTAFTEPGDPVSMHVFRVSGTELYTGEVKVLAAANPLSEQISFQHTADLAGRFNDYEYEWRIAAPVDGMPPVADAEMTRYLSLADGLNLPRYTIGGAGIQALSDNYLVMRYRAKDSSHPLYNQWSEWTSPKLAEGWIKRVLAGINPFGQRITDLFNNAVNTDASMLTQAGRRWEGDVALNLDTMNNYGLIEIYETVLRRGRMLSIESGYNYGPANDALLLAAGYLNDLYMMLGNEAKADAANPTIGIGTANQTYGDIATALFAFKGQTASVLEEELALLRGRDDYLMPGVQVAPVYNRLVWNYTRGIDSGEVIYALNYNIQENPNGTPDGIINAADAAVMFPQGHGDGYGHYLTALKGYYSLLLNSKFDWVPRIEAVNVLGQPVSVDYLDERKFASAAVALARAGQQVFDLTWRKDYQPVQDLGWGHFATSRTNTQRAYVYESATNQVTRYWGMDHWASRSVQGAYLNWVVGNAILPAIDPNPNHEGIQKIERSTVPELAELATAGESLQASLDSAEGGLCPLGVPEGGVPFDIDPNAVVGTANGTHFEQVYQRAKTALNNAVASFDDAKDVTRIMRTEQDSLVDLQARVADEEHAFNNSLIELYGTPYPDDVGPGKTYKQGYAGPDLVHYVYVETPEHLFPNLAGYVENSAAGQIDTFMVDIQSLPEDWRSNHRTNVDWVIQKPGDSLEGVYSNGLHYLEFKLGPHGFFDRPAAWASRRSSPGKIQESISAYIAAHTRLRQVLGDAQGAKEDFDKSLNLFSASLENYQDIRDLERDKLIAQQTVDSVKQAFELVEVILDRTKKNITMTSRMVQNSLPTSFIAGLAAGGDLTSAARAAAERAGVVVEDVFDWMKIAKFIGISSFEFANNSAVRWIDFDQIQGLQREEELRGTVAELGNAQAALQGHLWTISARLRELEDASSQYRSLVAQGDRLQEERQIFRQRSAAIVQGYRTRDAAFRIFRNEKLERYKTLFDLSARYALLAANAYDYETGLLGTSAGRDFRRRIIGARALGVVRQGEPQYAGSNTGDPGLSSALAEMKADWDVLRGRLGFNNPDAYGTTVSLRSEALRILPGVDGDEAWKDVLHGARVRDLLQDPDVRRYCMQIDTAGGLPVPGLVLTFKTTIADGLNLFGQELASGDHAFTPSAFATKIFGVGVAMIGYRGMDNPNANGGGTGGPPDPDSWLLDPLGLAATPYIYLIPVGVDAMRSPPLGDASTVRTWNVEDLAIPMPFNIGASDFSTRALWQSSDSLTEPLFTVRKHQAFRPVSTTSVFSSSLYGVNGTLQRSQFTNNRLVGRSAWNSQWKLVIPGKTLLNNPDEGLDRFIRTVTDIRLHFVTYSYSGN